MPLKVMSCMRLETWLMMVSRATISSPNLSIISSRVVGRCMPVAISMRISASGAPFRSSSR